VRIAEEKDVACAGRSQAGSAWLEKVEGYFSLVLPVRACVLESRRFHLKLVLEDHAEMHQ